LAEERPDSPRIRPTLPRLRWMERQAAQWPMFLGSSILNLARDAERDADRHFAHSSYH
jgi:hypothetical protein